MDRLKKARQLAASNNLPKRGAQPQPGAGPGAESTGRRRFCFRLLAAILVPALGLAVVELVLRLIGFGYPTSFWIRHPAAGPEIRVDNPQFGWRFFPRTLARSPEPIQILARKPRGACRVFVFGESAAIGDPAPAFGFSRILEVLLRERHPGTRFEVMNVSFTAINSHVILPIARDCQGLEGDFWLVYMGNNEVIGPFGAGTVFGGPTASLPVIRANLACKRTRVGQGLDALNQGVRTSSEAARGWGGMSMFLEHQVRRDDPRLAVVAHHFQQNLRDILSLGANAGARVVVSTMVSRVRDWPPFGSVHRLGLSKEQQTEWERLYQAGAAAEDRGDLPAALRHYEQAAQIDSEFADLHFRWGRACLGLGQAKEAETHLLLARDLDTLRFRTDSRLNDRIRQAVGEWKEGPISLLDAEQAFAQSSTNRLPGEEWFYEHVHFTFAGNYRLARLFAERVAEALPAPSPRDGAPARNWLSLEECAARLGYTDSQQHEILNLVRLRFEEPIYGRQIGHAERFRRLQQQLADLRGAGKPASRRRAMEACRQALASAPDDWVLRELTARLLVGIDDYAAAEAEWRQVARLIPHSARAYCELGKVEQQQDKSREALASYGRALEVNPNFAKAHAALGLLCSRQGLESQAVHHLRRALWLDPTEAEAEAELNRLTRKLSRRPRRKPRARSKHGGVRPDPAGPAVRQTAESRPPRPLPSADRSSRRALVGAGALLLFAGIHLAWRVDPALLYRQARPFFLERAFAERFVSTPGGLLHYLAAGVAQLNFIPWLGATLFAILLGCLLLCARRVFASVPGRGTTAAACALVGLLAALPGRYSSGLEIAILSLLGSLATTLVWLRLPPRPAAGPLAGAWLFGLLLFYAAGSLPLLWLVTLTALIEAGVRRRPGLALGCALAGSIVPAWWWFRPGFKPLADAQAWSSGWTLGLYATAFGFVPFWVLLRILWLRSRASRDTHSQPGDGRRPRSPKPWGWALGALAAAAVIWTTLDLSHRAAAQLEQRVGRRDWPGAIQTAQTLQTWSPTSRLHLFRALSHAGRLPEDLFAYPLTRGSEVLPGYSAGLEMTRALGRTLFELGQVNLAEHMAHEALELEGPRPDTLRLLADINLVKNQPEAARVFLRRLSLLPFHRVAAEHELRAVAADPSRADRADLNLVRTRLVRTDEPDPWLPTEILLRQLLDANRTNRMAFDYLLAHRLLREELPALADDLARGNAYPELALARPCEEALLALRESTPNATNALRGLPFRPSTADRYRRFREVAARHPGPSDAARADLAAEFGDTFWFYTLFGETAPARARWSTPPSP